MGYCIQSQEVNFTIPADKISPALVVLKGRFADGLKWVPSDAIASSATLTELMSHVGWESFIHTDGDFELGHFHGDKIGDDEDVFKQLAGFATPGSRIVVSGEDGYLWAWVVTKDQKLVTKEPRWDWDD